MDSAYRNYLRLLLQTGIAGSLLFASLFLFAHFRDAGGILGGYLLSFLFVLSNFSLLSRMNLEEHKKILKRFFITIFGRFAMVLIAYAAVLLFVNINQIFFTVSFIISYIFHSVIEIIFINKILENRHEK